MTIVSNRLRSIFKTGPQKATRKWPSIKDVKDWLAAKPRDEDFKKWYLWWIPPRRRAFVIILALALAVLLARGLYARLLLDANFDNPDKFEQTYDLNGFFPLAEGAVKIESNLFGLDADERLKTKAELRQWHGHTKVDSIYKLGQYLKFSSFTLWSSEPTITIATLPGEPNLQSSLQTLAKLGLVRFQPASLSVGAVYSFDLEMEVYRDQYSIGRYIETFNFRADSKLESCAFVTAIALAVIAVVFVSDLTDVAWDYRWHKYFKAMAGVLAEVLYQLKYPLKWTVEFLDVLPVINVIISDLPEKIINQLVEKLEQLISVSDDKEIKVLRNEAVALLEKVKTHAALVIATEDELLQWKSSLEEIVERTEKLRLRVVRLSKRRFRRFKAPLSREALLRAVDLANKTLRETAASLKGIIDKVNRQRLDKRQQHEEAKKERCGEIALTLNGYLARPHIKHDMEKLGEYFPLEVGAATIFETPGFRSEGKVKSSGEKKDELRYYENFYFPAPVSKNADAKLWLAITKSGESFEVTQTDESQDPDFSPAVTPIPAINLRGEVVEIRYLIRLTPANILAHKETREFQINPTDVALMEPLPDPEPWFAKVPLPPEPNEVRLD